MSSNPKRPKRANISDRERRFTRIFEEFRTFMRVVLQKRNVPTRDVDDLLQDLFERIWYKFDTLREDSKDEVRAYLFVWCKHKAANYCKGARHRVEQFPEDDALLDRAAPEEDLSPEERMHLEAWLKRRISGLRPKLQEAWVRHVLYDESPDAIAKSLKIPVKTVYARIALARQELARIPLR